MVINVTNNLIISVMTINIGNYLMQLVMSSNVTNSWIISVITINDGNCIIALLVGYYHKEM